MLHVPTLLFALILTDVVLAASLWIAIGQSARRGVTAWTVSLLLQATFFISAALRGPSPSSFVLAVANAIAALGYITQLAAILAFYNRPFRRAIYVVAAVAAATLSAAAGDQRLRTLIASGIFSTTMLGMAVAARRLHRDERRLGNTLLVVGLVAGSAILLVRGIVAVTAPRAFQGFSALGALPTVSAVFAHVVTIVCSLGFLLMHRERQEQEIERLAMTDALTGAFNRRTLFDLGEREVSRALRSGSTLSVVILDLDHFKRVNDTHGHPVGDAVLERFVDVVRGCLRKSDLLARYGGEEFCVLLPGEGKDSARGVAERIRQAIDESPFRVSGRSIHITSSAGIASLDDATDGRLSTIVRRADEALYEAKRTGRNRVVVAEAA